jgi:uncharacterized protein with HEPN domain
MTKRDIRDYLQDILDHIAIAEKFVDGSMLDNLDAPDRFL